MEERADAVRQLMEKQHVAPYFFETPTNSCCIIDKRWGENRILDQIMLKKELFRPRVKNTSAVERYIYTYTVIEERPTLLGSAED